MASHATPWNHPMCRGCWHQTRGDRTPVRLLNAPVEICCWCRFPTSAGIYTRFDPKQVACNGFHKPAQGDLLS